MRRRPQPADRAPGTAPAASSATPERSPPRAAPQRANSSTNARRQRYVSVPGMISRRCFAAARPPARLHADPPELAADGERARRTLSRDHAGPPRPWPIGAQDGELRRVRRLHPRARRAAVHARRLQHGRPDRALHRARRSPASTGWSCSARARASRTRQERKQRKAQRRRARRPHRSRSAIEAFAQEWAEQPLFAGPAASASSNGAYADRLRNTPHGLANALRGLGHRRHAATLGPARTADHPRDPDHRRARREVPRARRSHESSDYRTRPTS